MRKKFHILSRKHLNPTRIVAGSFAAIILLGAVLLNLPISSHGGNAPGFFTCLFTATSATCVTGLVLVDTAIQWSGFGQGVILAMIQMGGLGFMTVITLFSLAARRRIGLSERMIMVSTLNLNDMSGVVRIVQHTLQGTLFFEGIGAVILCVRFIPQFGFAKGLWKGIFHSVSAFCNAGFDLMGAAGGPFSSLTGYTRDPVVLVTIATLIVIGGLGFFVWEDVRTKRSLHKLSVYSKLVLGITGTLILGGAAFFLFLEYNNPATLGGMPVWEKVLNSFFQSVTLRTAGFNTIDQAGLTESSQAMSTVMMLIGGSSGSTAGGIKTATVGILLLALRAGLRGREEVTLRGRSISSRRIINAMTLTLMVLMLFLVGSMLLSVVDEVPYLAAAYEVASALGTVGLTTGITPTLSLFSQGVIVLLMYVGRVGILSFSIAFLTRKKGACKIQYPNVDIMIG